MLPRFVGGILGNDGVAHGPLDSSTPAKLRRPMDTTASTSVPSPPPPRDAPIGSRLSLTSLSILGLLVGIATGFGALIFRDLFGFVHNLLFLGKLSRV